MVKTDMQTQWDHLRAAGGADGRKRWGPRTQGTELTGLAEGRLDLLLPSLYVLMTSHVLWPREHG